VQHLYCADSLNGQTLYQERDGLFSQVSRQVKSLRDRGVNASALKGDMGKKAKAAVMNDLLGRLNTDGIVGPPPPAPEVLHGCCPRSCSERLCTEHREGGVEVIRLRASSDRPPGPIARKRVGACWGGAHGHPAAFGWLWGG